MRTTLTQTVIAETLRDVAQRASTTKGIPQLGYVVKTDQLTIMGWNRQPNAEFFEHGVYNLGLFWFAANETDAIFDSEALLYLRKINEFI